MISLVGARAEKALFLVKTFQKMPKTAFFGLFFFQNFVCGLVCGKISSFSGAVKFSKVSIFPKICLGQSEFQVWP